MALRLGRQEVGAPGETELSKQVPSNEGEDELELRLSTVDGLMDGMYPHPNLLT